MASLMSDARVVFLLWFVGIAIVIASVLIFIEVRLDRRKKMLAQKKREKTPIDRMRDFLNKDSSSREKLDVIGKTAKDYFRVQYGFSDRLDYSELAKRLRGVGDEVEISFCNDMFEAYYSNHRLDSRKIEALASQLAKIYRSSGVSMGVPHVPGFGDKLDEFMEDVRDAVASRVDKHIEAGTKTVEVVARGIDKQQKELVKWVRDAIHMGYDKMNLFKILNDGTRSKKEVDELLSIYDEESSRLKSGVAQRIIREEKSRLEEVKL